MKTKKTLLTLALLLAVLPIFADEYCNLELVDTWECPSHVFTTEWNAGLAENDGYLYFPGIDNIYILETDGSGELSLAGTAVTTGHEFIGDIVVRNDIAYVANAYNLLIYDVSDPLIFDSLGSCPVTLINQIFLMDTLLIAGAEHFHLINISDTTNPTYIRRYQAPFYTTYLPCVNVEDYPYFLVPCDQIVDPHGGVRDAYINVIDVTEDYTYSPILLDWTEYYGKIYGLGKVGEYYIGLTAHPHLTFFDMDSAFGYAEAKRTYNFETYLPTARYIQEINDTVAYIAGQDKFWLVNIADTSSIEVIAKYANTDTTDDRFEMYYDVILQDSILYVFCTKSDLDDYIDTMLVRSFLLDMSFSGQCSYYDKPEELELKTYPNPFNSTLQISAPEKANITIHDTQGRTVADLGTSRLWNAGDDVPSGVYIVRGVVGDVVVDGKAVLIR